MCGGVPTDNESRPDELPWPCRIIRRSVFDSGRRVLREDGLGYLDCPRREIQVLRRSRHQRSRVRSRTPRPPLGRKKPHTPFENAPAAKRTGGSEARSYTRAW